MRWRLSILTSRKCRASRRKKSAVCAKMYGADDKTCGYFSLHATADVHHSNVWRKQLEKRIAAHPENADAALDAAENAARMLWKALDGIEARRMATA